MDQSCRISNTGAFSVDFSLHRESYQKTLHIALSMFKNSQQWGNVHRLRKLTKIESQIWTNFRYVFMTRKVLKFILCGCEHIWGGQRINWGSCSSLFVMWVCIRLGGNSCQLSSRPCYYPNTSLGSCLTFWVLPSVGPLSQRATRNSKPLWWFSWLSGHPHDCHHMGD